MPSKIKQVFILLVGLMLFSNSAFALKGINVVYPDWFKQTLYDLPGDLQDASDAGKRGIMLFFSAKTCSYCHAMVTSTFAQADIVKRLRANYDVIGLDVFSDAEIVDTHGKTHWTKDFAVQEKARFTPTVIFYDTSGVQQLRMVGYQSPDKFRHALSYLDGGYFKKMKFGEYLQQHQSSPVSQNTKAALVNLDRRHVSNKPLLVIFETSNCKKCVQMRTMLKAPVVQPYLKRLKLVHVNVGHSSDTVVTPQGKQQSAQAWAGQLGLTYQPAMVFFNEQGKEIMRVDTDILIDPDGHPVSDSDAHILDNIRARLQFVLDKGYVNLPQFQRWRAKQPKAE